MYSFRKAGTFLTMNPVPLFVFFQIKPGKTPPKNRIPSAFNLLTSRFTSDTDFSPTNMARASSLPGSPCRKEAVRAVTSGKNMRITSGKQLGAYFPPGEDHDFGNLCPAAKAKDNHRRVLPS
jgi:hypothetical protein